MDIEKAKKEIRDLSESITRIENKAAQEGRGLNGEEHALVAEMEGIINALKKELPANSPLTQQNGPLGGGSRGSMGPYALIPPSGKKDWRSMFGDGGHGWEDKETNFFSAIFSGRHHPGLIRASMNETVPSEGGSTKEAPYISDDICNSSLIRGSLNSEKSMVIPSQATAMPWACVETIQEPAY